MNTRKIKHLIVVRFLNEAWSMTEQEILSPQILENGYRLLTTYLLPSLNKQNNKNFEVILLCHEKALKQSLTIQKIKKLKYDFKIICMTKIQFNDYIVEQYKLLDNLIFSRIDYDDKIKNTTVNEMQSLINDKFAIQLAGYDNGYKYFESNNTYYNFKMIHQHGFMSMFETIIYNTKHNIFFPPFCNHTKVITKFQNEFKEKNINLSLLEIIRLKTKGYVYVQHDNNISLRNTQRKYPKKEFIVCRDELKNVIANY